MFESTSPCRLSGFHQASVKDEKNVQQILRLLQFNLFEKRDLMTLLRGDPPSQSPV